MSSRFHQRVSSQQPRFRSFSSTGGTIAISPFAIHAESRLRTQPSSCGKCPLQITVARSPLHPASLNSDSFAGLMVIRTHASSRRDFAHDRLRVLVDVNRITLSLTAGKGAGGQSPECFESSVFLGVDIEQVVYPGH